MKKFASILMATLLIGLLAGCGDSLPDQVNVATEKATPIYKEYSISGVTFELPEAWTIEKSESGLDAKFNDDNVFTVWSQEVKSDEFDVFSEYFVPKVLKEQNGVVLNEPTKTTYASHTAYNFKAETTVSGKTAPVKVTTLSVEDTAIIFLLTYTNDEYDFEKEYDHMLATLK